MTVQQIIDNARRQAGDFAASGHPTSSLLAYLNRFQRTCQRKLAQWGVVGVPGFELHKDTLTTVSGQETYEVDIANPVFRFVEARYEGAEQPLAFLTYPVYMAHNSTTTPMVPGYFTRFERNYYIKPVPTTTGSSIFVYYYTLPADLTVDDDYPGDGIFDEAATQMLVLQMLTLDRRQTYDVKLDMEFAGRAMLAAGFDALRASPNTFTIKNPTADYRRAYN